MVSRHRWRITPTVQLYPLWFNYTIAHRFKHGWIFPQLYMDGKGSFVHNCDSISLINNTLVQSLALYWRHYNAVIMGAIASQINSLTVVYSIVYSDADQRKHQSSASLAFVREIHRRPANSPHKRPVTRKMFPFDEVIMCNRYTNH